MTRVALISLETWDEVWRRNQHLASRLVSSGRITELLFITPPVGGLQLTSRRWSPMPGITVLTPPLVVPRRFGGHRVVHRWLRRVARAADLIWINDPVAGAAFLSDNRPVTYDVTDDWRAAPQAYGDLARVIAAEDRLAAVARTIVCSHVLQDRWRERYAVEATLIPNGVDTGAIAGAEARALDGKAPHAVYVGTLHSNRIDLDLLEHLAVAWPGTLHLVGPNHLPEAFQSLLRVFGVDMTGAVPSTDVPGWLAGADVLICPHRVDDFTLSLDAIKSYEYLATDRPIVATPSSGFQRLQAPGLTVTDADGFVAAALAAPGTHAGGRKISADWADRAESFGSALIATPLSQGT